MKPNRVLVAGATGMLGRAVTAELGKQGINFVGSSRNGGIQFDAEVNHIDLLLEPAQLGPGDYVVNCVGLTKAHIIDDDPLSIERAVRLNVLFPIALARAAGQRGIRVIQVATDCVFSGMAGLYLESSSHDALDSYGKTKSLGEVRAENVMHLRCSLIGPEGPGRRSLFFEWVRGLEFGASIRGYTNHLWNGLTSQTFGKVVAGIVASESFSPGVQHLVPSDSLTKNELIRLELEMLGRTDIEVQEFSKMSAVDRTLATDQATVNETLFARAGYVHVPTIREMMEELPWEALKEGRN